MVTGNKTWALRGLCTTQEWVRGMKLSVACWDLRFHRRMWSVFLPFIVTAMLFDSSSHRSAIISSLHDVETFYSPAYFTVCPTSVLVSDHWGIHCSRAEDAHGEFTSIGIWENGGVQPKLLLVLAILLTVGLFVGSMYRDCLRNCREVAAPWLVVVRGLNAREERGFGWWWRWKKLLLSRLVPFEVSVGNPVW